MCAESPASARESGTKCRPKAGRPEQASVEQAAPAAGTPQPAGKTAPYSAASARASAKEGWTRQLSTTSLTLRPAVTARATTEISSEAWLPTTEPPRMTPVAGSEIIFTKPRGSSLMSARAEAPKGTFVTRIFRPLANASASAKPDVGDLRLGEHRRGRLVVVDVAVLPSMQAHYVLGHLASLHGGHRGKRQFARNVAGGVDVGDIGLAVLVDGDVTPFVDFHAGPLEAELFGIGHRAHGQQDVAPPGHPAVVTLDHHPAAGPCPG